MDFNFFSQADLAGFELEKARRALEVAKAHLEAAKLSFEDVMSRAEENGISKPKLRKLVDERVASLYESGLADTGASSAVVSKSNAKSAKKVKKAELASSEADDEESLALDSDSSESRSRSAGKSVGESTDESANEATDESSDEDSDADVSPRQKKSSANQKSEEALSH